MAEGIQDFVLLHVIAPVFPANVQLTSDNEDLYNIFSKAFQMQAGSLFQEWAIASIP